MTNGGFVESDLEHGLPNSKCDEVETETESEKKTKKEEEEAEAEDSTKRKIVIEHW